MTQTDYIVQAELSSAAFDHGPDAVIITDDSGNMLMVNTQAELLTGQPRRGLVGKKVEELIPPERREAHRAHRAKYMSNPSRRLMEPEVVLVILQTSGDETREIPVEINLAPVVISIGTVVILTIRQRGFARLG